MREQASAHRGHHPGLMMHFSNYEKGAKQATPHRLVVITFEELPRSPDKVIIVGAGKDGLSIIMDTK